jgi:hypothetical protein
MFDEEVINVKLDLAKATRENSKRSLTRGPLQNWWVEGVNQVIMIR